MYIKEYRFMLQKTLAPARRHTPTPSNWHYSRCRLDCQHPRDRRHHVFFRGSLTYMIGKFLTLSPRGGRQRQHTSLLVGQQRMESMQHVLTISPPNCMANSTTPDYLSLCPISLLDLHCKLCQDIVNQHCTIISCATTWRRK